jgi:uncharacterized protein (TIGR03083 family)
MLSVRDYLAGLAALQHAFADIIRRVDQAAPVPWCGQWQVRDVVVHLAQVHHWAAAKARNTTETDLEVPPDAEAFYRQCAQELRDTLAELPPDGVAWTLNGAGPVSFWHRRQLHETLIHLWDVRTAGGFGPPGVSPPVWADTVDEIVTMLQPRQVRLGRMARLPNTIALIATDAGRSWRLDAADAGPPVVEVRGPARRLALLLWGRPSERDHFTVTGDESVLKAALAEPLTP